MRSFLSRFVFGLMMMILMILMCFKVSDMSLFFVLRDDDEYIKAMMMMMMMTMMICVVLLLIMNKLFNSFRGLFDVYSFPGIVLAQIADDVPHVRFVQDGESHAVWVNRAPLTGAPFSLHFLKSFP